MIYDMYVLSLYDTDHICMYRGYGVYHVYTVRKARKLVNLECLVERIWIAKEAIQVQHACTGAEGLYNP